MNRIYPGATITAHGLSFIVWLVLFQDLHARDGQRDVEFVDNFGRYHHWKEALDAGTVTRNGRPGQYYRVPGEVDYIAAIRPAHDEKTFSARVIHKSGTATYYGRFNSIQAAEKAIETHTQKQWKLM